MTRVPVPPVFSFLFESLKPRQAPARSLAFSELGPARSSEATLGREPGSVSPLARTGFYVTASLGSPHRLQHGWVYYHRDFIIHAHLPPFLQQNLPLCPLQGVADKRLDTGKRHETRAAQTPSTQYLGADFCLPSPT